MIRLCFASFGFITQQFFPQQWRFLQSVLRLLLFVCFWLNGLIINSPSLLRAMLWLIGMYSTQHILTNQVGEFCSTRTVQWFHTCPWCYRSVQMWPLHYDLHTVKHHPKARNMPSVQKMAACQSFIEPLHESSRMHSCLTEQAEGNVITADTNSCSVCTGQLLLTSLFTSTKKERDWILDSDWAGEGWLLKLQLLQSKSFNKWKQTTNCFLWSLLFFF